MSTPEPPQSPSRRPTPIKAPKHWPNPPVPAPQAVPEPADPLDPVRYGDWEKKGIAVDF